MESFKQKRANLLNDNPIASHGSWISKHSIAAGSPLHQGGSGKSPLYQDKKSGDTKNTRDGGVIFNSETGKVVFGGGTRRDGTYVGKTDAQKASDWDNDPRNQKGSESKKRLKASQEKEFNKPENVAKREANRAKRDAQKAAAKAKREAKQTTKTEAVTETRDTRSNKERKQAAVDAKKAQSAKAKADILASRAEKKKIKASKNT